MRDDIHKTSDVNYGLIGGLVFLLIMTGVLGLKIRKVIIPRPSTQLEMRNRKRKGCEGFDNN